MPPFRGSGDVSRLDLSQRGANVKTPGFREYQGIPNGSGVRNPKGNASVSVPLPFALALGYGRSAPRPSRFRLRQAP